LFTVDDAETSFLGVFFTSSNIDICLLTGQARSNGHGSTEWGDLSDYKLGSTV